jgi:hypothetical protein
MAFVLSKNRNRPNDLPTAKAMQNALGPPMIPMPAAYHPAMTARHAKLVEQAGTAEVSERRAMRCKIKPPWHWPRLVRIRLNARRSGAILTITPGGGWKRKDQLVAKATSCSMPRHGDYFE